MLPFYVSSSMKCRFKHYASTVLIGGVFLTFFVLFLTMFSVPCEDTNSELYTTTSSRETWVPVHDLKTYLVVLVISSPESQHQRDTIRSTWLSKSSSSILTRFVVGVHNLSSEERKNVNKEQFLHNDMLLLDKHVESYTNLTGKLVLALQWADHNVDYAYLLKVDDDSFVRLDQLLKELKQSKQKTRFYWGFFNGRARVKKVGKWAEKEWFLCDRYLPYALGGGYVLSNDLVHYISSNSDYLQWYYSEDVSVGAWLGPLQIQRTHDERFDTEFVSRGCKDDYLITHKKTAVDMQELHKNLQALGRLCQKETIKRESYVYDWEVLPSQCCNRNDKILI